MTEPLTADTVTDEEIDEVRDMANRMLQYVLHAKSNPNAYSSDPYLMRLSQEEKAFDCARCAEILNQRRAQGGK